MFNAHEFSKLGLVRASSKDFRENGMSFKCYMYGDLRIFYYRNYENYFVLIKIPYQNYDFTYEDAHNSDWFFWTTKWYGCTNFSSDGLMESLKHTREGITDLQNKVNKETLDIAALDSALKDEINAAKITLTSFHNLKAVPDEERYSLEFTAEKLRKIIESPFKSYKDHSIRIQRAAMHMLRKYGYVNNEIHNYVSLLQKSFSWDFGIID